MPRTESHGGPGRVRAALTHPLSRGVGAILAAGVLLAGAAFTPVAGLARLGAAVPTLAPAPDAALPDPSAMPGVTVLTDAGGVGFAQVFEQFRVPVAPDTIAPAMLAAVVAIEDRRFYAHDGVDLRGVGRAALANLANRGDPFDGQGASTITMQYVKNHRLYAQADTGGERAAAVAGTLERKLADARIARRLEETVGKREILTRYLNAVYFGNGAYGVEAAAQVYFGGHADTLTVPQAALLAALIRSPEAYDPVANPRAAAARRDLVLTEMAATGAIAEAEAEAARSGGLGVVTPVRPPAGGCLAAVPGTGFYCRYVLDHLARAGLDPEELRTGGYTVRTALDVHVTAAARDAAAAQVPVAGTEGIANAVAVVQPGRERHRVLALAANRPLGPDAEAGQSAYLLPVEPVPYGAGSVFKIFTAAAALERGVGLTSELPAPEEYTSEVFLDDGEPYTVTGDNGAGTDPTLQRALALSPNTTFVALLDRLGSVDPAVDMAQRLGLRRSLAGPGGGGRTVAEAVRAEERASFTLGPVPSSPLELANVAATLVSGGMWCAPAPVDAVTDRAGRPVPLPQPPCERAVPEGLADALVEGLSETHTSGTAADAAAAAGWDRPMIGKTGTTQRSLSAAFVGATPQLAGAVLTWADRSPPRPVCAGDPPRLCAEGTLSGGSVPARTWFATMSPLHADLPVAALSQARAPYVEGLLPEAG